MRLRHWILAFFCALFASTATADGALDARYFDARGRALYARGEIHGALDAFLAAHRIAPSASTLYNVALTAELAHEDTLAWSFFEAYRLSGAVDEVRMADARARQDAIGRRVAVVALTSEPPGARVFVDRRDHGVAGTTPLRVAVSSGTHRLIVEAERHVPREVEVHAELGRVAPMDVRMQPRTGTVRFSGLVPDARIVLVRDDGVEMDATGAVVALTIGRYEARLVAERYEAQSVYFTVEEHVTADVALVARDMAAATGRLVVRSSLPAMVLVDGTARAPTPVVLVGIPSGRRRVEVRAPGFAPFSREVFVRRDASVIVDAVLEPTR